MFTNNLQMIAGDLGNRIHFCVLTVDFVKIKQLETLLWWIGLYKEGCY